MWQKGEDSLQRVSFIKDPFMRTLLSWPKHFLKYHLQIPSTLGLGFDI
jgi:hypothetical protein